MTNAAAVVALRRAYGESQSVFAERIGLSARTIMSYESKARMPDARSLIRLALAARTIGREDLEKHFSKSLSEAAIESGLGSAIRSDVGKLLAQVNGDVWLLKELEKVLRHAREHGDKRLPHMELLLAELNQLQLETATVALRRHDQMIALLKDVERKLRAFAEKKVKENASSREVILEGKTRYIELEDD
jgi:transcriptional regulator with XRE-family HTH domain